jgi:hypothetical protein
MLPPLRVPLFRYHSLLILDSIYSHLFFEITSNLQLAWTEQSTGSVVLAIAQVAPTRTPSQGPYRARITLLRIRRRDRVQRSIAQPNVAPALMSQLFWQTVIDADFRFDAESGDDSDSYWQPKYVVLLASAAFSVLIASHLFIQTVGLAGE